MGRFNLIGRQTAHQGPRAGRRGKRTRCQSAQSQANRAPRAQDRPRGPRTTAARPQGNSAARFGAVVHDQLRRGNQRRRRRLRSSQPPLGQAGRWPHRVPAWMLCFGPRVAWARRWTSRSGQPIFALETSSATSPRSSTVSAISIAAKGKTLGLVRSGSGWEFTAPSGWGAADIAGDERAAPTAITGVSPLINTLTNLQAAGPADFVESPTKEQLKQYGLEEGNPDIVRVEITSRNNEKLVAFIGKKEPATPATPPAPGASRIREGVGARRGRAGRHSSERSGAHRWACGGDRQSRSTPRPHPARVRQGAHRRHRHRGRRDSPQDRERVETLWPADARGTAGHERRR